VPVPRSIDNLSLTEEVTPSGRDSIIADIVDMPVNLFRACRQEIINVRFTCRKKERYAASIKTRN